MLTPPAPIIVAIDVDDDCYLRLLGSVADTGWRRPRTRRIEDGEYAVIEVQTTDDAYDTMIDVFDTMTGDGVASTRHLLRFTQLAPTRTLAPR